MAQNAGPLSTFVFYVQVCFQASRPVRFYRYQNKKRGTNARQADILCNGGPALVSILQKFCGDLEATAFRFAVATWAVRRGDSPDGPFVCGRIPALTRTDLAVCGYRLLESKPLLCWRYG